MRKRWNIYFCPLVIMHLISVTSVLFTSLIYQQPNTFYTKDPERPRLAKCKWSLISLTFFTCVLSIGTPRNLIKCSIKSTFQFDISKTYCDHCLNCHMVIFPRIWGFLIFFLPSCSVIYGCKFCVDGLKMFAFKKRIHLRGKLGWSRNLRFFFSHKTSSSYLLSIIILGFWIRSVTRVC